MWGLLPEFQKLPEFDRPGYELPHTKFQSDNYFLTYIKCSNAQTPHKIPCALRISPPDKSCSALGHGTLGQVRRSGSLRRAAICSTASGQRRHKPTVQQWKIGSPGSVCSKAGEALAGYHWADGKTTPEAPIQTCCCLLNNGVLYGTVRVGERGAIERRRTKNTELVARVQKSPTCSVFMGIIRICSLWITRAQTMHKTYQVSAKLTGVHLSKHQRQH